ncbi:sodium channel protein 60E-like [Limulus polyphemus]|uniref:Sodium channel protein 60E-like n=1 Tax=Limulus polyphemus TaxID=6850 RepID=A0ABM1C2E3_LIMPO|nr:sodium channel protein 60E-like [Limulus polyphemus]
MSFFGNTPQQGALDDIVNFSNFWRSFLLLFRLTTTAGWNDVFDSLIHSHTGYGDNIENMPTSNYGNKGVAFIYFVSFLLIASLIVNMYVAIVLENYERAKEDEIIGLCNDDLDNFYATWARFDPKATQLLSVYNLSAFLNELDPPLQIKKPNNAAITVLNIPLSSEYRLHCLDVLNAVVRFYLCDIEESTELDNIILEIEHKFLCIFPNRQTMEVVGTSYDWKHWNTAACIIAKYFKSYKIRRQNEAARVIQRAYRIHRKHKIMLQFHFRFFQNEHAAIAF